MAKASNLQESPSVAESSQEESSGMHRPWLIAVTGKVGSGKTQILAGLINYLRREGRSIEGLLSMAEGREVSNAGAQRYMLYWPMREKKILLCERTGRGEPPYHFYNNAWNEVGNWIEKIEIENEKPEVIILDEFGRLEANGKGFAIYWDRLVALNPAIIIVAIREDSRQDLEIRLGQKFDLEIKAKEDRALERLCSLSSSAKDWQRIGRFGAAAGAIEISLGSVLNATKIPFRGVPMSIIQAVVLFFAGSKLTRPWLVIWVSYISAALKTLSPAGNRFRPMIAIAMQGSLFGLWLRVLGWNMAGVTVGAMFVGIWAGLQGFIFQYLLLGNRLIDAYGELKLWFYENFGITIVSLPLLVGVYAITIGVLSGVTAGFFYWRKRPPEMLDRALGKLNSRRQKNRYAENKWMKRLLLEYRQKAFWVPLLFVSLILMLSGSSTAELAGLPLRAAGIIAVLFVITSVLKPGKWIQQLRKYGFWGAAITLGRILDSDSFIHTNRNKI